MTKCVTMRWTKGNVKVNEGGEEGTCLQTKTQMDMFYSFVWGRLVEGTRKDLEEFPADVRMTGVPQ